MDAIERAIKHTQLQIDIQLAATRAMIHCNGRKKLGKGYLKEMGQRVANYKLIISALEKQLNGGWIPVSERLPEANKDVQITFREYMNWSKKFRHGICKAIYIPEHSIKSEDMGWDDCDDVEVYDETEDTYYVKSGWYEIVENWEYTHVYINCEVTAWQPLPDPYKEVGNNDLC